MKSKPLGVARLKEFAVGILSGAAGFVASYVAWPHLRSSPWFFGFTAVVVTAWFAGFQASLLTTILLAITGRYFFMAPYRSWSLNSTSELFLLTFLGVATFLGFLTSSRRRVERSLRETRRRLESALAAGAIGTWTWDIQNDSVVADGNLAALFAISPADASGGSFERYLKAVHPDDIATVRRAIGDAISGGNAYAQEFRLLRPDGSIRIVYSRGLVERDAKLRAVELSGAVVDVTEIREVEKARLKLTVQLASQARTFDTALSHTADFVYTFDVSGRFTYANRRLLASWGKESHEAIGKTFFELGHPTPLADRLHRELQDVVTSKSRISGEAEITTDRGTRHYEYIFVPVIGENGEVEAVAGSTRDITERKQIEQATRKRAEQLHKLAGIATRINTARDLDSVVRVITEEARALIGARESATAMVQTPSDREPVKVISTAANKSTTPIQQDLESSLLYEAVKANNEPIRIQQHELASDPRWPDMSKIAVAVPTNNGWLAAPLVGRNGKTLGLLQLADKEAGEFDEDDEAILVQLSRLAAIAIENAKLYDELRRNDRRKDEFLAMLAHELRNPLAAISNAVAVTEISKTEEDREWATDVTNRQVTHLTRLIDDLLDVSRISRGKITLKKQSVEASAILENAIVIMRPLIEERGHQLNESIERGNLWVNVDPTRLEQVLVNLLNNAAKYTKNGGIIDVSAAIAGREVVITVKDNGIGIPPEKLHGMFDLFVQDERSLARSEGGLGIGLTVVKKLVEMHGGTVTARSEGNDKGSEFTIHLPRVAPIENQERHSEHANAGAIGKHRILVVEDNQDTARGMAMLLSLRGHEIAIAHDGHQAMTVAEEFKPEIVLLDIGLPGMDGYEVAVRLRREEYGKSVVIVAVSGYGQEEDRRRSKEAGFDHHLIKPLDRQALLNVLAGGRV